MKYKALITGKNTAIIDEFFIQMDDNFETVSTSSRFSDIMRHMKYFNPDLFVYCLSNENRESIVQMVNIKQSMLRSRIPVIIIGAKEECDEFEKIAVNVANMVLTKPITAATIQERLVKFMDERQPYKEAYMAEQEAKNNVESQFDTTDKLEAALQSLTAELDMMGGDETPAPAEKPASAQKPASAKKSAPAQDSSQRKHILIVDDTPVMLKTLKEHLHTKYDVATAVSGKIALKFLERKKTDLILLDYEMPEENGPAVLEKLRANEETKDIPVVFLTGVSDKEKIREALVLRPQSYLLKPIDREKLMDTIESIIG
ncbi:MAG: response regulator [Bacillus sp. (in: Bacteria)]|nr:response regulator [Bacillus sp. (in: firmicutes)]MCM1426543.1 response regulator [Eubacterium sp.]